MRVRMWTRFGLSKAWILSIKTYICNEIILNDYIKCESIYCELFQRKLGSQNLTKKMSQFISLADDFSFDIHSLAKHDLL